LIDFNKNTCNLKTGSEINSLKTTVNYEFKDVNLFFSLTRSGIMNKSLINTLKENINMSKDLNIKDLAKKPYKSNNKNLDVVNKLYQNLDDFLIEEYDDNDDIGEVIEFSKVDAQSLNNLLKNNSNLNTLDNVTNLNND